jgi:hypothetical protein
VTGAQTLAAFRRALLPVLLAALVTLAGVVGLMMSRPPSYQVRVALIATPVESRAAAGSGMDFGQVVSLGMPSLPEYVVADDVLAAVEAQVPGAPDAGVLRSAITVELVPASGVARVAVSTDDPATARAVLRVVVRQIAKADLLAPVAVLKPIGTSDPAAEVVGRDPLLALGLGLVAAIAVSLLTVVLVQTLRPRLLTHADVERIVDSLFEGEAPPPVVEVRQDGRGVDLLAAYLIAQDPQVLDVKVVASGPPLAGDFSRQMRSALRKVTTAREAGLALDPFGPGADPLARSGGRQSARHRTMAMQEGREFDDVQLSANGADASPGRAVNVLRGVVDPTPVMGVPLPSESLHRPGGPGTPGAVRTLTTTRPQPGAVPAPASSAPAGTGQTASEADATHLVVTVRLRRTTPVALTTTLITLRTHGTGIAGVAVS